MKPSISWLFFFFASACSLVGGLLRAATFESHRHRRSEFTIWNTTVWILKHYRPDLDFDVPLTPLGNTAPPARCTLDKYLKICSTSKTSSQANCGRSYADSLLQSSKSNQKCEKVCTNRCNKPSQETGRGVSQALGLTVMRPGTVWKHFCGCTWHYKGFKLNAHIFQVQASCCPHTI